MRIREFTILFTDACPLKCKYCILKDEMGKGRDLTEEEIWAEVERINNVESDPDVQKEILFTGGEPLLYWSIIKKIIEKYGHTFWYKFNSSGYLLTEEIIRFLAKYHVQWVLSVDGDEYLTNYLRPVKSNKYGVGYMKKLKKILPTFLFYFPLTPFRIIVAPRYVDSLHRMYLAAEEMGFRYFTFILDFESRPSNPKNGKLWTENDTAILANQLHLIAEEIIAGFKIGIIRPRVIEIDSILRFLAKEEHGNKLDLSLLPCQLLIGRQNTSILGRNEGPAWCMKKDFGSIDNFIGAINKEYLGLNNHCPVDSSCEVFNYCINNYCPKESYEAHHSFFNFEELGCALRRASYSAALHLLEVGQQEHLTSLYSRYLRELGFGGVQNGS